ncbi:MULTISPECIES: isoaspartyl peptidase/L-asparaginase family protein [Halomonadaceae]|uniref:Isoaspartyl peptidase n=1 Tax=Vreelandella halophila TaxID=86177 RepID=A0A9X4YE22_9GAMM|nr:MULTISPECIES: isoaspartyl peptidase/L-asparaginase [Halomonas]MYL27954.1 beta-aspartyl-peptidase [Halomonas utahensis]MYL75589.1 beta-aspartyl-peptidase [Halomonas sp. 22501_18_FS]
MMGGFSLAVHGGAGVLHRDQMTPEREADYHAALERVLSAGEAVLDADGSALDAVTQAVCALENEPLFNAGRGAVFTRNEQQEMDAALMDGRNRQAGAVAGIFGPKNPVLAARSVLEHTDHVLMIGEGALAVARTAGLDFEERDYFFTQERWDALQETLKMEAEGTLDDDPSRRHGTVGAVARDRNGHLAAATSTGGMTAKRSGRVGDSPVIGAGTYADDATCAVSATGDGEAFLRLCAAHEIDARMRLTSVSLERAAEDVIMTELTALNGTGGIIALDRNGAITTPFNCEGMYRGWSVEGDGRKTAIY